MECRYIGGRRVCGDFVPEPGHEVTESRQESAQYQQQVAIHESHSQIPPTTSTPSTHPSLSSIGGGRIGRPLLEGVAPTVKSLKEVVTGETTSQPIQQTQTGAQDAHVANAEELTSSGGITMPPTRPGRALLEGVAPTVKAVSYTHLTLPTIYSV